MKFCILFADTSRKPECISGDHVIVDSLFTTTIDIVTGYKRNATFKGDDIAAIFPLHYLERGVGERVEVTFHVKGYKPITLYPRRFSRTLGYGYDLYGKNFKLVGSINKSTTIGIEQNN